MACLGSKPRAAGWKVQTNPLSYGSKAYLTFLKLFLEANFVFKSLDLTADSLKKQEGYFRLKLVSIFL